MTQDNSRIAVSTRAFLRLEHETIDPNEVTALLGVTPTLSTAEGSAGTGKIVHGKVWVLSTPRELNSQDSLEHFKWLIEKIGDRGPQLKTLRERGFRMKIYCTWFGRKGVYGGPRLTPEIMSKLAELGVELYFDFGLLDHDKAPQPPPPKS